MKTPMAVIDLEGCSPLQPRKPIKTLNNRPRLVPANGAEGTGALQMNEQRATQRDSAG